MTLKNIIINISEARDLKRIIISVVNATGITAAPACHMHGGKLI